MSLYGNTWPPIKTNAPCGVVAVWPDQVNLVVNSDTGNGSIAFLCPDCNEDHVVPKNYRHVYLMITGAGIIPSFWSTPEEMREAKTGPAITESQVAGFDVNAFLREVRAES